MVASRAFGLALSALASPLRVDGSFAHSKLRAHFVLDEEWSRLSRAAVASPKATIDATLPGYAELVTSTIVAPFDTHDRPLIEAIPDAIDAISLAEIQASIKRAEAFKETHQLPQRFISQVDASPLLVSKLRGLAGALPVADRSTLPTVSVEGEPSVPHVDCFMSEQTNEVEALMGPDDRVAFLVADTQGEVNFRYADVTVPLEAGTFVHFRGDVPHYTTFGDGGKATLLGPFHVETPRPIGSLTVPIQFMPILKNLGDGVTIQGAVARNEEGALAYVSLEVAFTGSDIAGSAFPRYVNVRIEPLGFDDSDCEEYTIFLTSGDYRLRAVRGAPACRWDVSVNGEFQTKKELQGLAGLVRELALMGLAVGLFADGALGPENEDIAALFSSLDTVFGALVIG